jgi:hypothetical protein
MKSSRAAYVGRGFDESEFLAGSGALLVSSHFFGLPGTKREFFMDIWWNTYCKLDERDCAHIQSQLREAIGLGPNWL